MSPLQDCDNAVFSGCKLCSCGHAAVSRVSVKTQFQRCRFFSNSHIDSGETASWSRRPELINWSGVHWQRSKWSNPFSQDFSITSGHFEPSINALNLSISNPWDWLDLTCCALPSSAHFQKRCSMDSMVAPYALGICRIPACFCTWVLSGDLGTKNSQPILAIIDLYSTCLICLKDRDFRSQTHVRSMYENSVMSQWFLVPG